MKTTEIGAKDSGAIGMSKMVYQHFLLTRFNVRIVKDDPKTIPGLRWQEHRFSFFEELCLPSMTSQTNKNFIWFIFFDTDTPDMFRDKIEIYKKETFIEPVYTTDCSIETIIAKICPFIYDSSEYLMTSRLDNDDIISYDYIQLIQEQFRRQNAEFLNFPDGFVMKNGKIYRHYDNSNPFLSYIERIDSKEAVRTVWHVQHCEALRVGSVFQLPGKRIWIQVVHGLNVSNRIKDKRINRRHIGRRFLIQPLDEPFLPIFIENVTVYPFRFFKEQVIRILKKTVYALGLQELKNKLLNTRSRNA